MANITQYDNPLLNSAIQKSWKRLVPLMFIIYFVAFIGNDSNLLIVFYVQIMPDDFVMQLHRF